MSFWVYMLYCADQSFYVGHTDDLERRIAQHEMGATPGYTATRLPVKLVWSQDFETRDEAKAAEAQLKGWGKPKKLALIRGDWALVSSLAKGKGKASTSSARAEANLSPGPVHPELVEGLPYPLRPARTPPKEEDRASTSSAWTDTVWDGVLHPHLTTVPSQALSLEVRVAYRSDWLSLRYRLYGELALLRIAPIGPAHRADGLWQTTCFEAFVHTVGKSEYHEFNFAPSTEWAAYGFAHYREDRRNLPVKPVVRVRRGKAELTLTATIPTPPGPLRLGLSAVIEETNGTKSYWALSHPDPAKPDFHHPAGFTLELPAIA